ncbi:BQ5605_C009g05667 [Microbotryum silenes-dioicae]|uniref:BQ5605_C009g05667 protein n=1 Tax=Microbotryum silenes-dioicae TaxID=796604 RepID=A0A2X0MDJ9_9BASI|nr:BQ5605_C009g05667 [Microbotryum silenes-dioicae]
MPLVADAASTSGRLHYRPPPPRLDSLPYIHTPQVPSQFSSQPLPPPSARTRANHTPASSVASSVSSSRSGRALSTRTTSTAWSSVLDDGDDYSCDYTIYDDAPDEEDEDELYALYTAYEQHYDAHNAGAHDSTLVRSSHAMLSKPLGSTRPSASASAPESDECSERGDDQRSIASNSSSTNLATQRRGDGDVANLSRKRTKPKSKTNKPPKIDTEQDLLQQLARLSTAIDLCFCGRVAEEDSIYCGRECSRADALNALCGGQEGEPTTPLSAKHEAVATPIMGSRPTSFGSSDGVVSHYRRRVERKRAEERISQELWQSRNNSRTNLHSNPSVSSPRRLSGSSVASSASTSSSTGFKRSPRDLSQRKPVPTRDSTGSTQSKAPSLSSSLASPASSCCSTRNHSYAKTAEPASPRSYQQPKIIFPSPTRILPTRSVVRATGLTSNRALSTNFDEDLFASSLDATPTLATIHGRRAPLSDEEYGVPSLNRHSSDSLMDAAYGYGSVGLMMLQSDEDEDDDDEDDVVAGLSSGQKLKARVRAQMVPRPGHTRGKLSFDDVLNLLGS